MGLSLPRPGNAPNAAALAYAVDLLDLVQVGAGPERLASPSVGSRRRISKGASE
jgi:hypothetical protein